MEDQTIIQMFWDRNEDAIAEAEAKYGTQCYSMAKRILSHEDARECVNDTWLRIWNTIPPKRPNPLLPFLLKITRNLSIDKYKYNHSQKRYSGELPLVLEELHECVADSCTPEVINETHELSDAISAFLYSLPDQERNICIRRYFAIEGVADIGRSYGLSPNAVSRILSRTRTKLRNHLTEEGFL